MIKITLGIPTYQRLSYLRESVRSAQAQTYPHIEVLICDDGKDPEIQSWCESISREDPRIRYVKNAYRRGLAGNWNSILENASGEYIGIIGDDDRYLPHFVGRLMEGIEKGADIVFSSHYLMNEQGMRLDAETSESERRYNRNRMPFGFLENPAYWIWLNAIPMSSALFKRLPEEHRFDESLNTPEILFYLELAQKEKKFFYVPEFLLEFRVHSQSSTFSGLWTEKLVQRLIHFPVNETQLSLKNKMISSMVVNAVGRALLRGDERLAKDLIHSIYYKESAAGGLTHCIQWISLQMPFRIRKIFYRLICQFKFLFFEFWKQTRS